MRSHAIAMVIGALVGTVAMLAYGLHNDEGRLEDYIRDEAIEPSWAKDSGWRGRTTAAR
jgi:hypothetical protein